MTFNADIAATSSVDMKVALVTGSAKRLAREIILTLHQAGFRLIIH